MTLINHPQRYQLSWDNLLASGLTLSGLSYSKRHFEMIETSSGFVAVQHFGLAILEAIPIIGAISAIFERIIVSRLPPTEPKKSTTQIEVQQPQQIDETSNQQIKVLRASLFKAVTTLKTLQRQNEELTSQLKNSHSQFQKLHGEREELRNSLDAMHQEIATELGELE